MSMASCKQTILLLLIITFLKCTFTLAQYPNLRFDNFSMKDGLPDNGLNCLLEDHLGFIWIGTRHGLSKYDGYSFKNYNLLDEGAIIERSNYIWSLSEDCLQNLWIGTRDGGLALYLRDEDIFLFYEHEKSNETSISHNYISTLFEDSKGNMWVGTNGGGLDFLDKDFIINENKEKIFKHIELNDSVQSVEYINAIDEDLNGDMWVCTRNGLFRISESNHELYQSVPTHLYNRKNDFFCIELDKDNIIWLGSLGYGIVKFNRNNGMFEHFKYNDEKLRAFTLNKISSILIDTKDNFWAGARGGSNTGIFLFNRVTKQFNRYINDPYNPNSINEGHGIVLSIIEDRSGNIWIAQHEGNLNKINPQKNLLNYHRNYSKKEGLIRFSKQTRICAAENDKIWFASENGLFQYLEDYNEFLKMTPLNENMDCLIARKCWGITEDSKGNLWTIVGNKDKLLKYNPQKNIIDCFDHLTNSGSFQNAYSSLEDKNGKMWIATRGNGLYSWDPKTNKVINFTSDSSNSSSISDNFIYRICEDSASSIWISLKKGNLNKISKWTEHVDRIILPEGIGYVFSLFVDSRNRLWAGTQIGGIFLINTLDNSYLRINTDDGLPSNNYISGFCEDHNGNIFCCTLDYIIKFNKKAEFESSFKLGLEDEILHSASYVKKTKEIFVVSDKGFYRFYADSLKPNMVPPKIVLTDIKVLDNTLSVSDDSPLKSNINLAKSIMLEHWQNDISFQYSALHFINPNENKYKYYLENYDDGWKDVGFRREANYTNLSHGEYTFKVLGSNSDGIWAKKPATLSITILPPFWLTWWAYSIYIFLFLSFLTYLYYLQKRRLRLKHEMEMKEFEAIKLKEVDQMKSKFFANISHEFRTPLTLIKGPVERLINDKKVEDPKKIYKMIRRNSERLLNLINELLDLSKLESGHMKLSAQRTDIVSFTKGVALSFESLAIKKEISIAVNSSKDIIELYFDKEKLQKILSNIISNAFKFTHQNGKIELDISQDLAEQEVTIKISDNGIGIPKEELPKIFDRFYQVESSKSVVNQGTGIGLALTKELVEMHKGAIKVISFLDEGTTFILSFPLGSEHLEEDEIIYQDVYDISIESQLEDEISTSDHKKGHQIVLVVEDNLEVQNFIKESLEKEYRIIQAFDGQEGYDKAKQYVPDLIVSDIMMPKETGDRMCERLKTDKITSHIPIILLTAKASQEDKISGLETGADDYLIKPFSEKELLIRIDNLIKQRHNLREKYLREAEIHPTEVAVTSLDKMFIEQIIKLTDENISQSDFNIERFADKLAISRTQLYRKFTSILGEKPTEFVRKYRIRRSAELMKQNFGNIAQIAYEVGFNNLSYFAKCFKKIYKISPHQYYKNLHSSKSS